MKYLVILGDGMADYYIEQIKGTPLSVARKPMADALAKRGTIGLVKTVPEGFKPGSDTANLSVMGYEPQKYYTGRSPLEAYSLGIKMDDDDLALRCNLLTLSDEDNYADKTMIDYSAGEITPEEAAELMEAVKSAFNSDTIRVFAGKTSDQKRFVFRSLHKDGDMYLELMDDDFPEMEIWEILIWDFKQDLCLKH